MVNEYATLRCVLKVHATCMACKMHMREILGSIIGAYEIRMDVERSRTKIIGQVDPNLYLNAIARCDGHAELVWANLSHPKMRGSSHGQYNYDYGSSSRYDRIGESYGPRRSLAEGMWHDYPTSSPLYSANNFSYYDDRRQISQYPSRFDYTPYYHEEQSFCSIM